MLSSRTSNHRLSAPSLLFVFLLLIQLGQAIARAEEPLATTIEVNQTNQVTDEQMQKRLKNLYREVESLSDVIVEVREGIVILEGTVDSQATADTAKEMANRLEGTVRVENRLELNTDIRFRLETLGDRARSLGRQALELAPLLFISILLVGFGWYLSRYVSLAERLWRRVLPNAFITNLVTQLMRTLVIAIALGIALEILGAGGLLVSLAGGLGILGLALSFATRDAIENYIASILLSIKQPFAPLDHVIIQGQEGKIISLTARSTLLMSFEGNHIRIPNAQVYKAIIVNFTRNPHRRFAFQIGVAPDTELGAARELATNTVAATPGVLEDPGPLTIVKDIADSTVTLEIFGWVDQTRSDFGKVRSIAIESVITRFSDAAIAMPNPTHNLLVDGRLESIIADRPFVQTESSKAGTTSPLGAPIPARPASSSSLQAEQRTPVTPSVPVSAGGTPEILPESESRPADIAPDTDIDRKIRREHAEGNKGNLLHPQAEKEI